MNSILKTVLLMSFSGSVLAILLFLLRALAGTRASKTFWYYIWLPVLLRMVLPFGIAISLAYKTPAPPDFAAAPVERVGRVTEIPIPDGAVPILPGETRGGITVTVPQRPIRAASDERPLENNIAPENTESTEDRPLHLTSFLMENVVYLWLTGAVCSLAWYLLSYAVFSRKLSRSFDRPSPEDAEVFQTLRRAGNVRLAASIQTNTPLHLGLICPVIVLPRGDYVNRGMEKELRDVLNHELTHWRRHDVLYKWLAVLVQSIHWFNPIVYLMRRDIDRYCELSCDEAVVRDMPEQDRLHYGNTLLMMAAERAIPGHVTATTLSEGKKQMRERIISIRDYKRCSAFGAAGMLLVALLLTACAAAIPEVGGINLENEDVAGNEFLSAQPNEALPVVPVQNESSDRAAAPSMSSGTRYGNTSGNLSNDGYAAKGSEKALPRSRTPIAFETAPFTPKLSLQQQSRPPSVRLCCCLPQNQTREAPVQQL